MQDLPSLSRRLDVFGKEPSLSEDSDLSLRPSAIRGGPNSRTTDRAVGPGSFVA